MYIALLGRQPQLSIAELERLYQHIQWYTGQAATFEATDTQRVDVQRLGGSQKIGTVILEGPAGDWRSASNAIVKHYAQQWSKSTAKITLGISAYDFRTTARDVQKTGLLLKSKLKQSGVSLRLIPNQDVALSTATSHHNKLGLSETKVELLVFRGKDSIIVAESTGAQNITALAARDQGRPRRDAFVGMLPPKLAQIMINLSAGPAITDPSTPSLRILDPFCGTGVVLQEAALLGQAVYGTDISEKMIRYSRDNLNWLQDTYSLTFDWYLHEGDAMDTRWQQPITAVATEAYLGQPFSAPPSSGKLTEVRGNCNHIIGSFLRNLSGQLQPGTPVAVAVPAWRDKEGRFTHLPLTAKVSDYGFERIELTTIDSADLMYYRPDQVVAREILLLKKK